MRKAKDDLSEFKRSSTTVFPEIDSALDEISSGIRVNETLLENQMVRKQAQQRRVKEAANYVDPAEEVKGARKKAFEDAMRKLDHPEQKTDRFIDRFRENLANGDKYDKAVKNATALRQQCQKIIREFREDEFNTKRANTIIKMMDRFLDTAATEYAKAEKAQSDRQNKALRNLGGGNQRLSPAEQRRMRPGQGIQPHGIKVGV